LHWYDNDPVDYREQYLGDNVPDQTNPDGKRTHKATYASDKRNAGFNVRVVGPHANEFAGEEVPVETKSGEEHKEKLVRLLWTGPDTDPATKEPTGRIAALYSFEPRPKEITKPTF
jgi:hypothetical protein